MLEEKIATITSAAEKTWMIDLLDGGKKRQTAGYLIQAEKLTLIETGPGPSGKIILNALDQQGFKPTDLKYVVVTHIHLDHAGTAGYLLDKCPNAVLVVHPRGARHMIDPSRLIEGARQVFDDFDSHFLPVIPVPKERILSMENESVLDLGGRYLTFYHGEGHARHHFTILDSGTGGIFGGDLLGLYYPEFAEYGIDYCLPSTAPNQFDPEAFVRSLEKVRQMDPSQIFFSHFGPVKGKTAKYIDICLEGLATHQKITKELCGREKQPTWQEIAQHLRTAVKDDLIKLGWPQDRPLPFLIDSNIELNAKGLLDWWTKSR